MKGVYTILVIAILVPALSGCDWGSGGGATTETEQARRMWAAFQDGDYSFTVTRSCFCVNAGTYWVQVVGGDISIVQRVQDHEYLPEDQFTDIPTVEDLFDLIDRALRESADEIRFAFDPEAGYPSSISIDWIEPAADDKINYTIRHAVPGIIVPD